MGVARAAPWRAGALTGDAGSAHRPRGRRGPCILSARGAASRGRGRPGGCRGREPRCRPRPHHGRRARRLRRGADGGVRRSADVHRPVAGGRRRPRRPGRAPVEAVRPRRPRGPAAGDGGRGRPRPEPRGGVRRARRTSRTRPADGRSGPRALRPPQRDAGGRPQARPWSPLRRHGLLELAGPAGPEGWLHRLLRVPDRVRRHLVGPHAGGPTPLLDGARITPVPVATPTSAALAAAVLGGASLVHVHSWPGAAGTSTAADGLAAAGYEPLVVDVTLVPPSEVTDLLRDAVLEAALAGGALVVTGGEALIGDRERRRHLTLLDEAPVPVVLVAYRAWHPRGLATAPLSLAAPRLTADERAQVWHDSLGVDLVEEPDTPPVATLRLTPEEIAATADYARTLAAARDLPLSTRLVREAARALGEGASRGEGDVTRGPAGPPASFDDLVLPDRTLREIRRIVQWASFRDDVAGAAPRCTARAARAPASPRCSPATPAPARRCGARRGRRARPRPATGRPVRRSSTSTSARPRRTSSASSCEAESRDVVLFFDEADALFGRRSAVTDARDRYANLEVSYLLQRMEHFDGITVLATNLRGNLDAAFSPPDAVHRALPRPRRGHPASGSGSSTSPRPGPRTRPTRSTSTHLARDPRARGRRHPQRRARRRLRRGRASGRRSGCGTCGAPSCASTASSAGSSRHLRRPTAGRHESKAFRHQPAGRSPPLA